MLQELTIFIDELDQKVECLTRALALRDSETEAHTRQGHISDFDHGARHGRPGG